MTAAPFASLARARDTMDDWMAGLPDERRRLLATPALAEELTRLCFVDGYLRIRRTLPLILHAIERLDALGRRAEAGFWIDHLGEEAFHDEVMRDDLARMYGGSEAAAAVLRETAITPPSVALLGYFEWQVTLGNPGLLIALRLFLEWYVGGMDDGRADHLHALVEGGSRILSTHRELDQDHVRPCAAYVDTYCGGCLREVEWSIDFVGRCLRDAQLYLAETLPGRGP